MSTLPEYGIASRTSPVLGHRAMRYCLPRSKIKGLPIPTRQPTRNQHLSGFCHFFPSDAITAEMASFAFHGAVKSECAGYQPKCKYEEKARLRSSFYASRPSAFVDAMIGSVHSARVYPPSWENRNAPPSESALSRMPVKPRPKMISEGGPRPLSIISTVS